MTIICSGLKPINSKTIVHIKSLSIDEERVRRIGSSTPNANRLATTLSNIFVICQKPSGWWSISDKNNESCKFTYLDRFEHILGFSRTTWFVVYHLVNIIELLVYDFLFRLIDRSNYLN